jgi:L-threonylcarbamoyladenylate synthase
LAEILKVNPKEPDRACLEYAADVLRAGRVISIPTDTFYGLAADAFNLYAVEEVFQIKGRPGHKPLLLLVKSVEQAEELSSGRLPRRFYHAARRFWPGALTMVIEASPRVPLKLTGNTGKVAVRLPNAKVPIELIRLLGTPLTGTSANPAGWKECDTAAGVSQCLGERLPLILDAGQSPIPIQSTIIEITHDGWRLIREGAVPAEEIAEFFAA